MIRNRIIPISNFPIGHWKKLPTIKVSNSSFSNYSLENVYLQVLQKLHSFPVFHSLKGGVDIGIHPPLFPLVYNIHYTNEHCLHQPLNNNYQIKEILWQYLRQTK